MNDILRIPILRKKKIVREPKELREIQIRAHKRTDISDHLEIIFKESMKVKPKLIVELGVRGGESTFVFERVANLNKAELVSVDIDDCADVSNYSRWHFIKSDDISFGSDFANWCVKKNLPSKIDVLFIDTSHLFEHTVQEIQTWFPHLSDHAKVIFHDTNIFRFFVRKDGSRGYGWNNERGVIRAIEGFFKQDINEKKTSFIKTKGWIIKHFYYCNGLTILRRTTD